MLAENHTWPTADDIALAIVMAARAYGENAIEVASGKSEVRSRQAAFCALEALFPSVPKHSIRQYVGAPRNFLNTFERGFPKSERMRRQQVQWQIVALLEGMRGLPQICFEPPPPAPPSLPPQADVDDVEPAAPPLFGTIGPFTGVAAAVGELENDSCRWPLGDVRVPGFRFCGRREADFKMDKPYCREHAALS